MAAPIDFYFDFSSPFVVVDGAPFCGLDRFGRIERWRVTGAF
jgi:2-hydroxychromene-2-carboxylate isomerase